ncbi:type II secretion system minor pseudopilin GspI [Gammaproteobacteria bacterium]|nr:type II secretion system minor pseudopilin GspI [Gammaproteobacteria bacterium]MDA7830003.1 type II secretion system minor pseudopilin GspI [Gammaproteobacteria bacterium]MDA7845114.1 type II secretion system minor pseudopilin GspI [Gammaproteobacteria bacterium]MDA9102687.1 type II secretion system minor pseudopilin GspI [Gammaproteobacteria bacterium]
MLLVTSRKGFSLIEVVVALVILSTSILAIYNTILSTSGSVYRLEDHYLAKEVANNRITLIHTIERPKKSGIRNGSMEMGGKQWLWEESFSDGITKDFLEYRILVKSEGSSSFSYKINGYIVNE